MIAYLKIVLLIIAAQLLCASLCFAEQRYYIAPILLRDAGTENEYWSSKLNDLINVSVGDSFQEWHQDARKYSLCLVIASASTHAAIAADTTVIVASPLFTDDADRITRMNQTANISAVTARLEAIGLNTGWLTGNETYKDILRYVMRPYWLGQVVNGRGEQHMKDLIVANLTTQMKNIPAATRTNITNWMASKGLATGWIGGNTTVRQVLHFIVTNLNMATIKALKDEF